VTRDENNLPLFFEETYTILVCSVDNNEEISEPAALTITMGKIT